MKQGAIGSVWIALAVGVLALIQWRMGAEMTASLVAAIVGAAGIVRDAFVVLTDAQAEQAATRGMGKQPSKMKRFLFGG
jgi:hypothetical protein